jgi:peroxiredoxin family protein
MDEGSEIAKATIFEIIENQIRDNSPREVRQTLERLLSEGQTKEEAMKLIGCVVAVEIFEIMKHKKPFNESRYVENLSRLPEMPWEDDEENGI